jgi:hypothetical protein
VSGSYTSAGSLRWARSAGGSGCDQWSSVRATSDDFVVVSGRFSGIVDLGLGPRTSNGPSDAASVVFDPAGNPVDVRVRGSAAGDEIIDVTGSELSSLFVIGYTNAVLGACDNSDTESDAIIERY